MTPKVTIGQAGPSANVLEEIRGERKARSAQASGNRDQIFGAKEK